VPGGAGRAELCYLSPVLLYLHGFASGPGSHKARVLSERFRALGIPIQIPDLTPGEDGFERSSPSSMLAIAEATLARGEPPHAIIGSSLGGYLAALAASRDPSIERLVLMAPAFRLFERWEARLGPGELAAWRRDGLETMHFASNRRRRVGWQFFEDARRLPAFPEVRVPALCVGGTRDDTVPLADVEAFVERTPAARLVAVEDGHDLAASIERIFEEARAFLSPFTGPGSAR
jgi:pimeloyl-ACP methyl ester carboxylesterase